MNTLYMYKGLPGSGKTTAAKTNVLASNGKTKRINKDDLRAMVDGGRYSKANEKTILETRDLLVCSYLSKEYDVIVDDTNLDPKHRATLAKLAMDYGARYEEVFFDTSLAECIRRDSKREHPVGEKKITEMYNRYLRPKEEGPKPLQQNERLPKAIICDLDGTLCHLNGRNPYDASTCGDDTKNQPVVDLVSRYNSTHKIIFVSGRKDTWRDETNEWILDNIPAVQKISSLGFHLYMRKEGDDRKDSLIKEEIFNAYVRDQYYIDFVLDDRQQVVDMWRRLGLTCFQVAPGNF